MTTRQELREQLERAVERAIQNVGPMPPSAIRNVERAARAFTAGPEMPAGHCLECGTSAEPDEHSIDCGQREPSEAVVVKGVRWDHLPHCPLCPDADTRVEYLGHSYPPASTIQPAFLVWSASSDVADYVWLDENESWNVADFLTGDVVRPLEVRA